MLYLEAIRGNSHEYSVSVLLCETNLNLLRKLFLRYYHRIPTGFPRDSHGISTGFPPHSQQILSHRISTGISTGFPQNSHRIPKGFPRVSHGTGFPRDSHGISIAFPQYSVVLPFAAPVKCRNDTHLINNE